MIFNPPIAKFFKFLLINSINYPLNLSVSGDLRKKQTGIHHVNGLHFFGGEHLQSLKPISQPYISSVVSPWAGFYADPEKHRYLPFLACLPFSSTPRIVSVSKLERE